MNYDPRIITASGSLARGGASDLERTDEVGIRLLAGGAHELEPDDRGIDLSVALVLVRRQARLGDLTLQDRLVLHGDAAALALGELVRELLQRLLLRVGTMRRARIIIEELAVDSPHVVGEGAEARVAGECLRQARLLELTLEIGTLLLGDLAFLEFEVQVVTHPSLRVEPGGFLAVEAATLSHETHGASSVILVGEVGTLTNLQDELRHVGLLLVVLRVVPIFA